MELGLAGKHALVTGSTAGIGYAIARGLAAEGASVIIAGRTQPGVDAALKRLKEAVPDAKATGIAADCATAAGAQPPLRQPRRHCTFSSAGAAALCKDDGAAIGAAPAGAANDAAPAANTAAARSLQGIFITRSPFRWLATTVAA